jgi:hypothetical protein
MKVWVYFLVFFLNTGEYFAMQRSCFDTETIKDAIARNQTVLPYKNKRYFLELTSFSKEILEGTFSLEEGIREEELIGSNSKIKVSCTYPVLNSDHKKVSEDARLYGLYRSTR